MAKKAEKTKEAKPKADRNAVLIKPRITEKATMVAGQNTYTFEISPRANKTQVVEAIKSQYKVVPIKVNVVNLPAKMIFRRGKLGRITGTKKALVFLKPGDKIEFA